MGWWAVHGTKTNATISYHTERWRDQFKRWFHKRDIPQPLQCIYAEGIPIDQADAIRATLEREQQR